MLSRVVVNSLFFRQVLTLLSGSVLAQLITVLIAPLLSRLYTPEAFGFFAIFIAVVSAISPGITGRYDVASVVAKDPFDSRDLYNISIVFNAGVSLLLFALTAVGAVDSLFSEEVKSLGWILLLIPVLIFTTGVIASCKAWANRNEDYHTIANSLIYQNLLTGAFSLLIGLFFNTNFGLIYAGLIGPIFVLFFLLHRVGRSIPDKYSFDFKRSMGLARKYKDYPLFNASTSLLNGFMSGLPVFFLAKYFSATEVGYYALLIRVGALPLSAVADAVSRVNFRKVTEIINSGQSPIPFVLRLTKILVGLALIPLVILVIFSPGLFAVVFGDEWVEAGRLLSIIMPALAVQFVVSTLSLGFLASGRLRILSAWQIFSLILTVAIFYIFGSKGDIYLFFWAYMLKDIFLYIIYYVLLVFCLKNPIK